MGQVIKRNLSLILTFLLEALSVLEEWDQVQKVLKQLEYIMKGAALVVGMSWSFRGHDIFSADLHGTFKKLASGHDKEGDVGSYIIISFMGIFKVKTEERDHLTPIASIKDSGVVVRTCIVLLIADLVKKEINNR